MKPVRVLAASLVVAALTTGCSGGGSTSATSPSTDTATTGTPSVSTPTSTPTEPTQPSQPSPAVTESNPPGDIPDNQAFVSYQPPAGGFSVKVPEGWARTTAGGASSFTDKLNRIQVQLSSAPSAPTPQSVTSQLVPTLQRQVPKFALGKVTEISRPAGKVVLLTYQGDSSPDAVTGKVVRNAFEDYLYYQAGKLLAVTLSGPVNADNVDPWKTVSDSVRWQ